MPIYTYRREDGTTFDLRQKFSDDPLTVDPQTGQKVVRIVQAAGVIFKGSGFYITDSKGASKSNVTTPAKNGTESKAETPAAASTESSNGASKETTPAATPSPAAAPVAASAAAD
jgi:putative FmdB family regulatory protein